MCHPVPDDGNHPRSLEQRGPDAVLGALLLSDVDHSLAEEKSAKHPRLHPLQVCDLNELHKGVSFINVNLH